MFRRFFKRRAAKAAKRKAKKQVPEPCKKQAELVLDTVAEGDRGTTLQNTSSKDSTEVSSVSRTSPRNVVGTFAFPTEAIAVNHEKTIEVRKMKVEIDELHTKIEEKDGIIAKQDEEISELQNELSTTTNELGSVKSTLTMKLLELKARQQDVLDKDFALQQMHHNHNDDPIHNVVSFGLNLVGHLPFFKI